MNTLPAHGVAVLYIFFLQFNILCHNCSRVEKKKGVRVGWEEDNILVGLDDTLFDTAREDITNTLDFVDTGDGHTHRRVRLTGWHLDEAVQHIQKRVCLLFFSQD